LREPQRHYLGEEVQDRVRSVGKGAASTFVVVVGCKEGDEEEGDSEAREKWKDRFLLLLLRHS
jgi:hypothetical protein